MGQLHRGTECPNWTLNVKYSVQPADHLVLVMHAATELDLCKVASHLEQ